MEGKLTVQIIQLPPMRIASFYAFGPVPELDAWQKLVSWVEENGLTTGDGKHRVFGFNNPNPSPGSPNYGYEWWLSLDGEDPVPGEEDAGEKRYPGGLFAVTRCRGADRITDTWRALISWCEESAHTHDSRQWLEEYIGPLDQELDPAEIVLDLHLPLTQ